jgi:hypothetical protein
MCSILCWILSIWETLGWKFCIFSLIHALSTRGRSLSLKWLAGCIQKVFRWFRAISGLWCAPVWPVEVTGLTGQSAGPVHMLHTSLTSGVDRSDRLGLNCCSWPVFKWCFACSRPGGVALVQGACMCAGGALCGCSSFGLVICALCLSIVLSRMCRAVALA